VPEPRVAPGQEWAEPAPPEAGDMLRRRQPEQRREPGQEWAEPAPPEAAPANNAGPPFTGIVLTGGASRRMGRDKAFLAPDDGGPVLAERCRRALTGAGAVAVVAVGGDAAALAALGFTTVPDSVPGAGPLGGVVDGLGAAATALTVVLSCDLPAIDPGTVRTLVDALAAAEADAVLPVSDGRWDVLVGAYRREARDPLAEAFAGGERSLQRAVARLVVVPCSGIGGDARRDVDHPEDLDHYARGRRAPGSNGGGSGPGARRSATGRPPPPRDPAAGRQATRHPPKTP
jgi:molybdopterin-guanine dinucleotide biosynthesis protein A